MLEAGDNLPNFVVLDEAGNEFTKENLLGKFNVIFFYPKDNTPGCTKEACDFSSDIAKFDRLGVGVFGMSKDSPWSHQGFIKKHSLQMRLLSDESTNALQEFGVIAPKKMFGKEYMGIVRSTFIVDPKGKLSYVFSKVSVLGHSKKVYKKLQELMQT